MTKQPKIALQPVRLAVFATRFRLAEVTSDVAFGPLGVAPHFMKTLCTLLCLLMLSRIAIANAYPLWDNTKPPTLPMPPAYQLAITSLGQATNQFHCVSAGITREFAAPGWDFTFYSTNASVVPRIICVQFDRKVIEVDLTKPR